MRITLSFLFFCILFSSASNSYSQKFTIKSKTASIKEVCKEIEKESDYVFIFSDNCEKLIDKQVNVEANSKDVTEVLNAVLSSTGLTYKILDKQIVVYKSTETAPPVAIEEPEINIIQQPAKKQITGKVVDAQGDAIIGANIIETGTTNGTVTDIDGKFSLNVENNSYINISYIGYLEQSIATEGRSVFNITLLEDTKALDEVVVVGYGTQRKVNLTGAVSQVGNEALESRPISNIGQGLQGLIPNLNISSISGRPGRGVTFNIRGMTSITGGQPLILVDGVEMDINIINPRDVESISVLKDASSSAIYGARAAFGVILVSTKRGKQTDKLQISYSSNYSINKPTVIPEFPNSVEYANWMNEGWTNTNGHPYIDNETMDHIHAYFNDPVNNLPVFHHSADASNLWRYCGNTNWIDEWYNKSYPMQQHSLSINGGTDRVTYYTSIGYFNQKGMVKPFKENYNRYNIMNNINYMLNKWLSINARMTVNKFDNLMTPQNKWGNRLEDQMEMAGDNRPTMPVYHPDGNYAGYSGNGYFTNIVAFNKQAGYQKDNTTDVRLSGAVKISPTEFIDINLDYTYNVYNKVYLHHMKEYWDYDATGPATLFPHTTPNSVTRRNTNNYYSSFNAFVEFEKDLTEKNYLKTIIGFNQEKVQNNGFSGQRIGLISNNIPYMSLASGDRFVSDSGSEYALRGVFGRINYTFDRRFLLEINGRYDGSSRFPQFDRFAFFPSGSAGWRMSNENFFEPLRNTINELKLRVSYGQLGNQAVQSFYPYLPTYGTSEVNYIFDGEKPMTVTAPGLVSPTLTWETITQQNFGIDFALFDNIILGSVDVYRRDTKDMLTRSRALPSILGTNEPQSNAADLKTNGYEITFSYHKTFGNDFRFDTELIFSDNQSEITKYDNPNNIISDYYVGQKIGDIWGFVTEGLFQSDSEAAALDQSQISGHKFLAGDIKFKDLDNDNKITRGSQTLADHGDMTIIGNNTARYNFGVRTDVTWKSLDLNLFFQGVGKRDFRPNNYLFLNQYSSEWNVPQKINIDYWTPDNPDALFPRPRIGNSNEVFQAQTRFLQNAAYVRLKQLTIGYTLPKEMIQKAGIDNVRIYFSGNNVWEYSPILKIFDPEITSVQTYPLVRSFSIGLDIVL